MCKISAFSNSSCLKNLTINLVTHTCTRMHARTHTHTHTHTHNTHTQLHYTHTQLHYTHTHTHTLYTTHTVHYTHSTKHTVILMLFFLPQAKFWVKGDYNPELKKKKKKGKKKKVNVQEKLVHLYGLRQSFNCAVVLEVSRPSNFVPQYYMGCLIGCIICFVYC